MKEDLKMLLLWIRNLKPAAAGGGGWLGGACPRSCPRSLAGEVQ